MSERPGRSTFVLAVVWLATLAGPGCSKPPSTPPPSPPAAPIVVSGTLLEGYTGRPITLGEVALGDHDRNIKFKAAFRARTDSSGRFRLDGVQAPDYLFIKWLPDETAKKTLLGIGPDEMQEDHSQTAYANPGWGDLIGLEPAKAGGQPRDLGTVYVWIERAAQAAFGRVCDTGRPGDVVLAGTPFVLFTRSTRSEPFTLVPYWHKELAAEWPQPWKAVACVTDSEKKMGSYSDTAFHEGSTKAYQVTWDVRLIRLPDGKTFRTKITADPPQQIQVDSTGRPVNSFGDVRGDPKPQMRAWVKSLPG